MIAPQLLSKQLLIEGEPPPPELQLKSFQEKEGKQSEVLILYGIHFWTTQI